MKSLTAILALLALCAFNGSIARAETAPAAACCGCPTGTDAKVCGVDKDCCCTGEKASKGAEKKAAAEAKKAEKQAAAAAKKAEKQAAKAAKKAEKKAE